jgi:hypothetical protein
VDLLISNDTISEGTDCFILTKHSRTINVRNGINPTSEGAVVLLDTNTSRTPRTPRLTRIPDTQRTSVEAKVLPLSHLLRDPATCGLPF